MPARPAGGQTGDRPSPAAVRLAVRTLTVCSAMIALCAWVWLTAGALTAGLAAVSVRLEPPVIVDRATS